jgi:hypothetical protein
MIGQTIELENLSEQLEGELEIYQKQNRIRPGDMAWILLRIGTNYYLKDLCSRQYHGNGQSEDNAEA